MVDYQRLGVALLVILILGALTMFFVIPSYLEGSLGEARYAVDATTSICGTLYGAPTGTIYFTNERPTGFFSLVGLSNEPMCLVGICQIDKADLQLSGPVNRSTSISGGFTIPVAGQCLTTTTTINGLVKGNYSGTLKVLEGGVWTQIATQPLVIG